MTAHVGESAEKRTKAQPHMQSGRQVLCLFLPPQDDRAAVCVRCSAVHMQNVCGSIYLSYYIYIVILYIYKYIYIIIYIYNISIIYTVSYHILYNIYCILYSFN